MSTVITSKQKDTETWESVAILAGIPTIIGLVVSSVVLVGAWAAFVAWKFYGWFVVPLGAPVLNWWHAWGLLMLYGLITYKGYKPSKEGDNKTAIWGLIGRVVGLALTLLLGWLIHGQI